MKKLLAFMLAVLLTGCSGDVQEVTTTEDTTAENTANLTTVCHSLSGEIKGGENGWYEVMRHSDGSADLIYTDIETGIRAEFGQYSTINAPYGSLSAVFAADGFVYHYFYGFPESMNKAENSGFLYQYDTQGNFLQALVLDKRTKFPIGSSVVSDGEKLYFSGYDGEKSNIYSIKQSKLEPEIIYQSDDRFTLYGGYENRLVLFVIKDGTRTMETLDMATLERKVLLQTKFPWKMLDDSRLYSYQDSPGILKIYDLETDIRKDTKLFSETDCVNSWQIPYPAADGRYLSVYTSQYEGNLEKAYIYDLQTEKLAEVQRFYGKAIPAAIGEEVYCIAPVNEDRIYLNNALTERIDYNYIIISLENLLAGNSHKTAVENQIDYR